MEKKKSNVKLVLNNIINTLVCGLLFCDLPQTCCDAAYAYAQGLTSRDLTVSITLVYCNFNKLLIGLL